MQWQPAIFHCIQWRTDANELSMKNTDDERAAQVARQLGARIRDARQRQNITLNDLSGHAGLSAGFLSRLERGETNASISNLIAISSALRIPLRDFFADPEVPSGPAYVLTRSKDRSKKAPLIANGYTYNLSSGDLPDQQMSAFELTFPPGEKVHPKLVKHEGEEVLFLLEGTIEFVIGSESFVMKPGDCVHFNCEQPHMGRNIGRTPARLLMIVTPMHSLLGH
jgi:transcriptional regulator with XRE-family HTH domain